MNMIVVNTNQIEKEPFPLPLFTSPEVTRQVLLPQSKEYEVNVVNFGKGVRNKFHSHDYEQVLIVTAGEGIIATEEEEKVIAAGDVIFIPANEVHWHGATADSEFSHIYINSSKTRLTQHED
jgi:quercetin dioxygenase-like cupin family protein